MKPQQKAKPVKPHQMPVGRVAVKRVKRTDKGIVISFTKAR
jgi:hypothetical protein